MPAHLHTVRWHGHSKKTGRAHSSRPRCIDPSTAGLEPGSEADIWRGAAAGPQVDLRHCNQRIARTDETQGCARPTTEPSALLHVAHAGVLCQSHDGRRLQVFSERTENIWSNLDSLGLSQRGSLGRSAARENAQHCGGQRRHRRCHCVL